MTRNKIFGISANLFNGDEPFAYAKRAGVYNEYCQSVQLAGGIPIILPPLSGQAAIELQLNLIDVLLLSGGSDISPSAYGEDPSPLLGKTNTERDSYELTLVKMAHAKKIPIFGICRGLQLINVAFGGTLYQDLSLRQGSWTGHKQQIRADEPVHNITIAESSLLCSIIGQKNLESNSFHHQGVKQLAPGFTANAWAEDGLIEGIEMCGTAPILGVQWHPEMLALQMPSMLKIFAYFNHLEVH